MRQIPIKSYGDIVPSPDAYSVVYTTARGLHELTLDDGRLKTLAEVGSPWSVNMPSGISISRSGDAIAVSVVRRNPFAAAALVFSRTANAARLVTFPRDGIPVAWADNDRLLLALSWARDPQQRNQLFAFDEASGHLRELGLAAEQPRQFRLQPGRNEMLFSAGQTRLEFWWLENADR